MEATEMLLCLTAVRGQAIVRLTSSPLETLVSLENTSCLVTNPDSKG